ncbi:hypothetical protein AB6D66_26835 [Vibrio pomeroyi]|uniref:Uncharacterized protein n=1 Tax=Vibrio pomeroyi TaxID=198832 RepID=A0ABV4N622_9VIBR
MLERLSANLQNNPKVIIGMFGVTILSTIMTVVLGWADFYNDYLSKSITIPIWLVLLLVVFAIVTWIMIKPVPNKELKELELVEGKPFGVQQVTLDGRIFRRCEFHGSELIINGEHIFKLENNDFNDSRFTFGGSASMTIAVLTEMYSDPAFRPLVDQTLKNIQLGKTPISTPVGKVG